MGFQSLPNELLFIISRLLNQPDLNALIQTCQLFHTVLNTTLYVNNVKHDRSSALFWAASTGNIGTIQRIISHGGKVRTKAEGPFMKQRSLNVLRQWNGQSRMSPRTTRQTKRAMNFSTCGETPLHRAAEEGQEAAVMCLLDHGSDMMTIDTYGYFPIQLAAHRGHESIVNIFLEKGFDPNTLGWSNPDASVIHSAVCGGHANVVKLLLEHGAQAALKKSSSPLHPSPLDMALSVSIWQQNLKLTNLDSSLGLEKILKGQEDCAMLLIEHATQLDTLEENRYMACAARRNYVRVVKALLELGIDPNLPVQGKTALGYAKSLGCEELIDLLEPLASPNGKSKRKKRKTEV